MYQSFLETSVQRESQPAIIDRDGTCVTFGELHQQIAYAARYIYKLKRSDDKRTAFFLPMSAKMYPVLIALLTLGHNVLIPDPWIGLQRINRLMKSLQPDQLVIDHRLRHLRWIMPGLRKIPAAWAVTSLQNKAADEFPDGDGLRHASVITFTGGSSGQPKGVIRTADILEGQLRALQSHIGREDTSVLYTHYPMVALAGLMLGKTIVIPDFNLMNVHKAHAGKIIRALNTHRVDQLIVSPALLRNITSEPEQVGSLKHVITGGAPVSGYLIRRAQQWMPACRFEAVYGSSEAEPMACIDFREMAGQLHHPQNGIPAGSPVPELSLKIIPPELESRNVPDPDEVELVEGETGEIVVAGPHVNRSYYGDGQNLASNKIKDRNGRIWHRTGDIGYLKNGSLYLTGSRHLQVCKNGSTYNPWPAELLLSEQLELQDVAYVQDRQHRIVVCAGSGERRAPEKITNLLKAFSYPVDRVRFFRRALPRDPRHRSKINLHKMRKML